MLQRRPPAQHDEAFICTFECTFCRGCTANVLKVKCREPRRRAFAETERAEGELAKYPAYEDRFFKRPFPARRHLEHGRTGRTARQRSGQELHPAPAGAAGQRLTRKAPKVVSQHGLKPYALPQSPCVLPSDVRPPLRGLQHVPVCRSDRQLQGAEISTASVSSGP